MIVLFFSERNDVDKYIYNDEGIISRTLEALREMGSKNSGIIVEIEIQKYIDQVYPAWTEKDLDNFNRVYTALKIDVEEKLAPFIYDPHREDEFEKQFDGIKVLPSCLIEEYRQLLDTNRFINAEALKVSISKQRFASLLNNDGIHHDISAFQLLQKGEIKEQSYYIINRKYTSELGLQLDIKEQHNNTII